MLELNGVRLRAFEQRDLPRIVEIHNDLDLELVTQPTCPTPRGVAEFRARLEAAHPAVSCGDPRAVEFAVARASDPDARLIGIAGLHEIDEHNGHAEIGVTIADPEARGHGLGIDAYVLLAMYAMQVRPLNKVYGHVKGSNAQALGTMRRLGLTEEAVFREHRYLRGTRESLHVFSLLKTEWTDRLLTWREWAPDRILVDGVSER
jgi:RimJ/RimL family protein N-acetyltransferase